MKKTFTAVLFGLLMTACGAADNNSETKTSLHPDTFLSQTTAKAVDGNIVEVRAEAASQGSGLWTEIDVEYQVSCTEKFEKFSYVTEQAEGKLRILASAIVTSQEVAPGMMTCQAFSMHKETISISGLLSRDNVELVNLKTIAKRLPKGEIRLQKITHLDVASATPLCEKGAVCKTNGTVVALSTYLGCFDSFGPSGFAVKSVQDDKGVTSVELAIAAYAFSDKRSMVALCTQSQSEFEITLDNVLVNKENIKVMIAK